MEIFKIHGQKNDVMGLQKKKKTIFDTFLIIRALKIDNILIKNQIRLENEQIDNLEQNWMIFDKDKKP